MAEAQPVAGKAQPAEAEAAGMLTMSTRTPTTTWTTAAPLAAPLAARRLCFRLLGPVPTQTTSPHELALPRMLESIQFLRSVAFLTPWSVSKWATT